MNTAWNRSSNGLPREGQQIEFILDRRSVALEGTYERQVFHSQWAGYDVDRVCSWRDQIQKCDRATAARNQAAGVLSSAPRHVKGRDHVPAGGIAHA